MSPLRTLYTRASQASVLLPIIAGFANYKRLTQPFRILLYFFIAMAVSEVSSTVMGRICHNNNPVMHMGTLLEFLAFSTVYFLHFRKNNAIRFLIGINTLSGIIVAFVDAFYLKGIWHPPTVARPYFSISIVLYALIYFYFLFKDVTQYSWEHPMFWVNAGALLYFGSNVLYFILIEYLILNEVQTEVIGWITHDLMNIIAHILYAQSFRCFRKQIIVS